MGERANVVMGFGFGLAKHQIESSKRQRQHEETGTRPSTIKEIIHMSLVNISFLRKVEMES
jgi:hypothetical protein